ncbi:MAG: PTS sugar transporter subunit IIB [Gemmatimonadota bacterium]|nr:PTS sugar transporter subunit IIB [Gemmatimonadota bacterium]
MSVVLYRIDERLIHGQVVVGWGPELEVERYVVVDDELAASEWEQDLYRLGLPEVATAEFLTVADARARLSELDAASPRTVVLTRTITAMNGLAEGDGLRGCEVNLGGLHYAAGRTERVPYVYLGPQEEEGLQTLADEGVEVSARDLPGSRAVALEALLG